MTPPPLEFRPAWPRLRDLWALIVFGLLAIALFLSMVIQRKWDLGAPLAAVTLLLAGGLWIEFRLRFPGSPRLAVDSGGMAYRRGGSEKRLSWDEVAAILVLHDRSEMRFVLRSGPRPIAMHRDMTTVDGQRFDMLIEEYWSPQDG